MFTDIHNINNENEKIKKNIDLIKKNGYAIIRNLISLKLIEEVSNLFKTIKLGPEERITSYRHPALLEISNNKTVQTIADNFFKESAIPIQSLLFKYPTKQPMHQDTVHFSTYPRDLMLSCWVALEDINIDNGPLEYIEKSHLLPTFSHYEYPTKDTHKNSFSDDDFYHQYEKEVEEMINKLNLKKSFFIAKAGDCIIWHPRLLHGGDQNAKNDKTRKSYVTHYMASKTPIYFKHFGGIIPFIPRLQFPKNINTGRCIYSYSFLSLAKRLIKLI